ncbi:hypothetical protein C6N75_11700 [Streptomyces solincola]|uniref:Uncharacterized protein n=1 Tax=Streptomyces solincola TaxID=2100817 RepID=A0A2S9PXD1_9ACTN|nr:hypothetical protein [Streptomyces solincola]PRH79072.1 hypothetical protein C6N75_11700 [Streptomyces solincola]
MRTPRLGPGAGLVTGPDGRLVLRTADGEFLRVATGTADPEALTRALTAGASDGESGGRSGGEPEGGSDGGSDAGSDGRSDSGSDAASDGGSDGRSDGGSDRGSDGDAELARLAAAFEEAGHATADPVPRRPLDGHTVLVLGDAVLTGPLRHFAAAEGADVRSATPEEVAALADGRLPKTPTAVVWCLDAPVPPGRWDAADRLPGRGIGWLRCHREGAQLWIEPLADRPGDVTSACVRRRRLAATAAHRELAAYWDGHRTPDNGPRPTAASAALVAALLTAALAAWAAGPGERTATASPPPARRTLRRVDLRDLRVTDHPVLPVPDVAPLRPASRP